MDGLSPATWYLVQKLFAPAEQAEAGDLLVQECGTNLPFCQSLDEFGLERVRFAALKVSGGDLGKLYEAVDLAQQDWRDLLMAAGFGHSLTAHREWYATYSRDKSSVHEHSE